MEYRNQGKNMTHNRYAGGTKAPSGNNTMGGKYSSKGKVPLSMGQYHTSTVRNNSEANQRNIPLEMDQENTVVRTRTPMVNQGNSTIGLGTPNVNQYNPAMNMNNPTINQNTPTINMNNPTINQGNPMMGMRNPMINQNTPPVNQGNLTMEMRIPIVNQNNATINQVNQTIGMRSPVTNQNNAAINQVNQTIGMRSPVTNQNTASINQINQTIGMRSPTMNQNNPVMEMKTPMMNHCNSCVGMQNPMMNHCNPPMEMRSPIMNHCNPPMEMRSPIMNHCNPPMEMRSPIMNHCNPPMEMRSPMMNQCNPCMETKTPMMNHRNSYMETKNTMVNQCNPYMEMNNTMMNQRNPYMEMHNPMMNQRNYGMQAGTFNVNRSNPAMAVRNGMVNQNYEYSEMEPLPSTMYEDFPSTFDGMPAYSQMSSGMLGKQGVSTPLTNRNMSSTKPEMFDLGPINPNANANNMQENYAQVRILNTINSDDVYNITVGNTINIQNLAYGEATAYEKIPQGYQTVTVSRIEELHETMLITQSLPLVNGEDSTLAIVKTAEGLEIIHLEDTGSNEIPDSAGCLRVANMSYDDSAFDVMAKNGEAVFTNLRYMDSTILKQAEIGDYDFYITKACPERTAQEKPVIEKTEMDSSEEIVEHLLAFGVDINEKSRYTAYIIGDNDDLRLVII